MDFSDSDCDTSEIDENFDSAANYIQGVHNKLLPNDLLDFYALYKQGTTGPCNIPKPGIFNIQSRAKWSAWNNLGTMPKVEAKRLYIEKLSQLDPKWIQVQKSKPKWVVHSTPWLPSEEMELKEDVDMTIFDYVKDKNLEKLKHTLDSTNQSLDTHDDNGLGLIHWASDRNTAEILEFLLSSGANVNLRDSEGQTALHYASSCGNLECVRVLLKFGADKELLDNERQSALSVTEDECIRKLLEK